MEPTNYVPLECLTTADSTDSLLGLEDYYFTLRPKEVSGARLFSPGCHLN